MEQIRIEEIKNDKLRWDYYYTNWEVMYFNEEFKLQIDKLVGTPYIRLSIWVWNNYANDWFQNKLSYHRLLDNGRIAVGIVEPRTIIDYLKNLSMHLRGRKYEEIKE